MRDLIRRLGQVRVVILITILAIISALGLEYLAYKTFSFPYTIPSTPIVSFFVTATLAPLISWPFIRLILFIDDMEQKMYNLATYDSMTKLFSRQAFFKHSLTLHDTFKASNKSYCVCILDLDNFKSINDTYGHAYGDKVLINFGELMHKTFDENYIIGRIGGEEFSVVVEADAKTLKQEMDKFHKRISKARVSFKNSYIPYTASIGIFEHEKADTSTFDEALSYADDALYEAKVTGKNKTVIFSDALSTQNTSKKSTYMRSVKSKVLS